MLVPNLAGWRRERTPSLPEEHFTLPPDWVCEVLSPATTRTDRTKKVPLYARAAIPHLWLIEPIAGTLEVYGLEGRRWVLLATHGGDETVRVVPFESVAMDLKRLWDGG